VEGCFPNRGRQEYRPAASGGEMKITIPAPKWPKKPVKCPITAYLFYVEMYQEVTSHACHVLRTVINWREEIVIWRDGGSPGSTAK